MFSYTFVVLLLAICYSVCFYDEKGPVHILDAHNFKSSVLDSDEVWLVEFYAPWCGHCKALKPEWEKAAGALYGIVNVGAVDATENQELAQQYGVQGYPTIKIFGGNKAKPEDYQSGRDAKSISTAALKTVKELISDRLGGKFTPKYGKSKPKETKQESTNTQEPQEPIFESQDEVYTLKTQQIFDDKCPGKRICVIAFLPSLFDEDQEKRDDRIKILNEVVQSDKKSPFVFFWTPGGLHREWEEKFSMDYGYPSILALHKEKKLFGVHTGAFSVEGIKAFLIGLSRGSKRLSPLPELPSLIEKEEELPGDFEEEVPLDDIMGN